MRVVHCKKERYDVYIGRPSALGNPFVIGKDGSRKEVIEKFEQYARKDKDVLALIRMLSERTVLGCWCAPQACHGDVIVKLFSEMKGK